MGSLKYFPLFRLDVVISLVLVSGHSVHFIFCDLFLVTMVLTPQTANEYDCETKNARYFLLAL